MSKALIDAAASYFGMDPAQLAQGSMSTNSDGLRFTFIVQCQDEDYLGIADRMRAMRQGQQEAMLDQFVGLPTVQEVMADPMRYVHRPECADVLARATQLSKAVRTIVEQYASQSMRTLVGQTEGAGGREVKHVDVPAEEDSGALPDAVWVDAKDLTDQQKHLSSDYRGQVDRREYLVQVSMLTPEQLDKAVKP